MLQPAIIMKQLKIEGFNVGRWSNIWNSGIEHNLNLIKEVSLSLSVMLFHYCYDILNSELSNSVLILH